MPGDKAKMYRAYLLRYWLEGTGVRGKKRGWRYWVEEILGERRRWGFASWEEMVAFLQSELTGGEGQ